MDRTAQQKAITDILNPPAPGVSLFQALALSDAAAAKSGASGTALNDAQHALTAAQAAFAQRTGRGSAVDAAQDALDALTAQQPLDFQAAIDARAKFNGLWQQMVAAVQALLQNPGEVENVSGKV